MHRPLLKKQIEYAQTQTKSHWAAARFLNVSYPRYKKFAISYGLFYNDHLNPAGKGIHKKRNRGVPISRPLQDIFNGKYPNYNRKKLHKRLVRVGMLEQKCAYCGANYTREDGKGPYVLDYRDGNGDNLAFENLQIICFNCRFLTRGTIVMSALDALPFLDQDIIETSTIDEAELLKIRDELQNSQFNQSNTDDSYDG